VACYDVRARKKFDYSYPEEMTSMWEGITVSGERESETALASNGSGAVLPFTIDGFDVDWSQLDKPGGKRSKMAARAAPERRNVRRRRPVRRSRRDVRRRRGRFGRRGDRGERRGNGDA
jgi:hypothetical protein